jgi:hypothetical protein
MNERASIFVARVWDPQKRQICNALDEIRCACCRRSRCGSQSRDPLEFKIWRLAQKFFWILEDDVFNRGGEVAALLHL